VNGLRTSSKLKADKILVLCWIGGGAALPHPTAPPARDGSIDELEELGVVTSVA